MIETNKEQILKEIEEACLAFHRKKEEITLVAVTKNRSFDDVMTLYRSGCRDLAENRLNEALAKIEKAPQDIRWHFIGKIQRNKVAKMIGRFALIHSVDCSAVADKISCESEKKGVVTSFLIEVNTSQEASKSGYSIEECRQDFPHLMTLRAVAICGLMTMAPLTADRDKIRACFSKLKGLQHELEQRFNIALPLLSMGMSNDFQIAIGEGATHVRIGSKIFNEAS